MARESLGCHLVSAPGPSEIAALVAVRLKLDNSATVNVRFGEFHCLNLPVKLIVDLVGVHQILDLLEAPVTARVQQ